MAGKIQNEDIKSQTELVGAGGQKSQLPNSEKVYLESFGEQKTLKEALDERLLHGTPLEMHQGYPADSKLYFEPSVINTIEGKARTVPPVKSQIPNLPASSIDFQTGATTGGTFDATFPTSTPGQFRRLGFSLLSNGVLKGIFSAEAASVGALANPGTVFVKGALPVGYIDLEATAATAFKTAGSVTNIIEHKLGSTFRIFSFGSGGGGGSGTGDTTDFEQSLQRRLEDSVFKWATPNVFAVLDDTLVDPSSTAEFDIANSEYDFGVGDILLSKQHFGSRFLAEARDTNQLELIAQWNAEDENAVWEVTKNGVDYETVEMSKLGDSFKYRGIIVLQDPAGSVQHTYAVANASAVAELNATTRQSYAIKLPEILAGSKKKIQSGKIYVNKTGTPVGDIRVKLVSDNAGAPGSTVLGFNAALIDIGALSAGNNEIAFDIPTVVVAQNWWLVVETSAYYKSSFSAGVHSIAVRVDTSSPSWSEGASFEYDGTVWAAHVGNHAVFELTGYDYDLRVRATASQVSSLAAYAVLYGESEPQVYESNPAIQRFDLDGSEDETELTITNFLPEPTRVKVYIVNTDKVLVYPKFAVDGKKLVFAAGTFFIPGETVVVIVDQVGVSAFDNSDVNRSILAMNRFGSTDPSVPDFSLPGEGPVIRADNNKLVEYSLRWNGSAYEWVFAEV